METLFRKKEGWGVMFLLGLALFLRLWSAGMHAGQTLQGDATWYDATGWLLASGGEDLRELDFFHPPLYPIFLSLIYRVFGRNLFPVLIIQAFLGTATCALTYLIGKRILGPRLALLSLLLCVFSLSLIKVSSMVLSESLFTFLFITALYLLLRVYQGDGWRTSGVLGICLGLASLTKTSIVLFPVFLMGGILTRRSWSWHRRFGLSLGMFLAFYLVLLPWELRNLHRYGQWTPISTNGGVTFYSSYRPPEGKLLGFITHDETTHYANAHFDSEIDRSRFLFREGWRFIRENPGRIPRLEALKIGLLWSPFDWEVLGGGMFNPTYGFLLPFILWGMAASLRHFQDLWVLYVPLLYLHVVSLVFQGTPRYRLPFEPVLILFGAVALARFFSFFSRKWVPSVLSGGWLGAMSLLFVNSDAIRLQASAFAARLGLW